MTPSDRGGSDRDPSDSLRPADFEHPATRVAIGVLSIERDMLKVDPTLDHVPARSEHVIALYESINQPLVNIPSHGTGSTGAFVLGTRNDQGAFTAFVYLHQPETRAVIVYVSEPRALSREAYRHEEQEAVRFVESMGFMIDNVHFATLAPPEQAAVMARIPMFRPPAPPEPAFDPTPSASDPFASTDQQLDAIFGGLSQQDAEVFRSSTPPESTIPDLPRLDVPASGPTSSPSNPSPPPARPRGPDPATLERLGRLLGTFCLLLFCAVAIGCKSGGTNMSPEAVGSQVDIGNQQLAQGQNADAIRTFQHALEMDENSKEALRGIALAYMNLGIFDESERYYRQVLELDDAWSMPKNELAVVLIQTNRCEEAQTHLEKVLKDIFYPTPQFAEHNLARALACQGDVDGAVDRLEKLMLKQPKFCLGYLTLAQLAAQDRRHEVTITACDDFTHHCEEDDEIKKLVSAEQSDLCYLKKGLAYAELGDLESARASFLRCQSRGQYGKECRKSLEMLPQ